MENEVLGHFAQREEILFYHQFSFSGLSGVFSSHEKKRSKSKYNKVCDRDEKQEVPDLNFE